MLPMDSTDNKLNSYRQIIEQTLTEIADYIPQDSQAPHKTIFDCNSDSYALVEVGWTDKERVHQFIVHVEISDGKVWIQADNTDLNITRELERAGIPKSDIVLGFQPPAVRRYTEYAAA
jgi:hypothetical protein